MFQVPEPTVYRWLSGDRVPEAHFRMAIERVTEGAVLLPDWLTEAQVRMVYPDAEAEVILNQRRLDSKTLEAEGYHV